MFERGLSARTIEYTNAVLESAFRQAVRWKMLGEDPCTGVDLPRVKRKEMEALSVHECRRFLEVAEKSEWYPLLRGGAVTDQNEAFRMLDTFASVGATHFDLTHINIEGEKRGFRPQQTLTQLKNSLPRLFPGATARQNNIIVRPHTETARLIQLDDLKADGLDRVRDAFLTLQTSPGNHQAWIAVSGLKGGEETKDFARRLRKGAVPTHRHREPHASPALPTTNANTNLIFRRSGFLTLCPAASSPRLISIRLDLSHHRNRP
jgi:hypothetical protein